MSEPVTPSESPVEPGRPVEPHVVELVVENDSDRVIRVSAHFPFARVDWLLRFDRRLATGRRLDLPESAFTEFGPHTRSVVRLVRLDIPAGEPTSEGSR